MAATQNGSQPDKTIPTQDVVDAPQPGSTYHFELLCDGAVVGGGWVVAPNAEVARSTAGCQLAGLNQVRLLPRLEQVA